MTFDQRYLLGAQEILFYALNEVSPKHFVIVTELEGQTNFEDWQHAVHAISEVHPILRMSIAIEGNNLLFKETIGQKLPFTMSDWDSKTDLSAIIKEEMETALDSAQGPLARIRTEAA